MRRANHICPVSGISFEREEGYFLVAMYFSYFLAVGFLVAYYATGCFLLPAWPRKWVACLAVVVFPFTPLITQYARMLPIHYDCWEWAWADFPRPPT